MLPKLKVHGSAQQPKLETSDHSVDSEDHVEDFEARHPHQEDSHGGGHGGTEMGWLVSYADMMTLLVGLFVLLFSLAKQGGGKMEETMKQVSNGYFNSQGVVSPPVVTQPVIEKPVVEPITKPQETAAVKLVEKPVEKVPEQIVTTDAKDSTATITELNEKLQATTKERESLEVQKGKLEKKLAELQKSKETTQSLKTELAAKDTEIESLKESLKAAPPMTQAFAAVVASWSTEKHDVDLTITDPSGKTYSFKRRSFKGQSGRFEIDSRYGPGIEMWKTEKLAAGIYRIRYALYSLNGNNQPAKIQLSVVTNSQSYKTPDLVLKEAGSSGELRLKIEESGKIETLP